MKVIIFAAISVNGIIAQKNNSENFLSDINWQTFSDLAKKSGCFIVGRKTYELVQKWPDYNFDGIQAKLKIIVSHKKDLNLKTPYSRAKTPIEAIKKAKALGLKTVIIAGGSTLYAEFIRDNLVDEIILNLEPALVGSGVPLCAETAFEKRLSLKGIKKIAKNIIQLKYKVIKN